MIQKVHVIILFVLIPFVYSQIDNTKCVVRKSCEIQDNMNSDDNILHVYEPDICYSNKKYFCDESGNPKRDISCGITEYEEPEELNTECIEESNYYYECVSYPFTNMDDYVKENSCDDEYCTMRNEPTIYVKPFTCVNMDNFYYQYLIAGHYVRKITYNDICNDEFFEYNLKIYQVNVTKKDGENTFKLFSFEVYLESYNYLFFDLSVYASQIVKTNTCVFNTKLFIFKKYDSVLSLRYSEDGCNGDIEYVEVAKNDILIGYNSLPQSKNMYYATEYLSLDECINRDPYYYVIINDVSDNWCFDYETGEHITFNNTHVNVLEYACLNQSEYSNYCNEHNCSSVANITSIKYNECFKINDVYIVFYPNAFKYFGDMECDSAMNCESNGIVYLTEDIIIESNITITNSSVIVIDPRNTFGITVGENGNLNIEGGRILFNISDDSEFSDLLTRFNDTDEVIIPLIKGRYSGKFHDIKVEKPQNSNRCENVDSELEYREKLVNILFTLDKSKCGLKWWIIFIIVVSAVVVVVAIVSAILFFQCKQKKMLKKAKARNSIENKESVDMDTFAHNDKSLYEGKGKVNPMYEA